MNNKNISEKSQWNISDFEEYTKAMTSANLNPHNLYINFDEKRLLMTVAHDHTLMQKMYYEICNGINRQLKTNLAINHSNYKSSP